MWTYVDALHCMCVLLHIRISSQCKHVDDITSNTNLNHYTYLYNIKNKKCLMRGDPLGVARSSRIHEICGRERG
jgi:hypothetical protein